MATREKNFAKILIDNEIPVHYPQFINRELFEESEYNSLIKSVYLELGGISDDYPINFGNFDIVLNDCFIEIDEENHFNRYRALTLRSSFYKTYNNFPITDYLRFCTEMEKRVGKSGNFWSNNSSENQFNLSSAEGDLTGNGSSRWKQRAFYDFLKDVFSEIQSKPVYRFSIYEDIRGKSLNGFLKKPTSNSFVFEYFQNRISHL